MLCAGNMSLTTRADPKTDVAQRRAFVLAWYARKHLITRVLLCNAPPLLNAKSVARNHPTTPALYCPTEGSPRAIRGLRARLGGSIVVGSSGTHETCQSSRNTPDYSRRSAPTSNPYHGSFQPCTDPTTGSLNYSSFDFLFHSCIPYLPGFRV